MKYASYFVELSLYFLFLEVLIACFSTVHSINAPKKVWQKEFFCNFVRGGYNIALVS